MIEPDKIAEVRNYDDLVEAFRLRKSQLGLSDAALEDIVDLAKGHVSKLLGSTRPKMLGPFTFDALLAALALKFVVVPDLETARKMESRWERRDENRVHAKRFAYIGAKTMQRVLPEVCREMGKRGGAARVERQTPEERSASARLAAQARWRRYAIAEAEQKRLSAP